MSHMEENLKHTHTCTHKHTHTCTHRHINKNMSVIVYFLMCIGVYVLCVCVHTHRTYTWSPDVDLRGYS